MTKRPEYLAASGRAATGQHKSDGAFYTNPVAAELLSELALLSDGPKVPGLDCDLSDIDEIATKTIMDPACGGGALLVGMLRTIRRHHVALGGDGNAVSRVLVERVLIGWDIWEPALVEARERLLAEVEGPCGDPELILWPHGPQPDGSARAGALEALAITRTPLPGDLPGLHDDSIIVWHIGATKTPMRYCGRSRTRR